VPPDLERFSFVLLRRPDDAPDYTDERLGELQEQHIAHLASLHERGVLLLAGPFDDRTDESLRGLCVFRLGLEETREAMAQDPSVLAGRMTPDVMSWWTARGSLPASESS
jgi:uncharacterized protein YciI